MNILHLLYAGGTGGIEKLCKDIGIHSKNHNLFFFAHNGGSLYDEMKKEGLPVILRNFRNFDIFGLGKQLINECKKNQVEVIVVHHSSPLLWLAGRVVVKKMKEKSPKIIIYTHNNYFEITTGKFWKRRLYNSIINKCDAVISISNFVKETIINGTHCRDQKFYVVYNGIEADAYHIDQRSHTEKVRILFLGRLIQKKGVQLLLEALTLVKDSKRYELSIVGTGDYMDTLTEITRNNRLIDIVTFYGEQRDVKKYYENADIFVHPAIWEEGFGITLLEAMSAGLICVAFRRGAIPEIIENNISGYIINEVSADALALKLDQIANDMKADSISSMREQAILRSEEFSIDRLIENMENVFMRVLNNTL